MAVSADMPPPAVPASLYDEDYYRHCCAGADAWEASQGQQIHGLYIGMADRVGIRPGDRVVDLGTGRGEFLVAALAKGASSAIGIEYSEDALKLARQTLEAHDVADRAEILQADVRRVPQPDQSADIVTLLDVVEHLNPDELSRALSEGYRLLRPGGRLIAHTFPTRTIYNITYRAQRLLVPQRWKRWPADPRFDIERSMHVNEQSLTRLRTAVRRAGFRPALVTLGQMVYTDFVPDDKGRRLYGRLARVPGLRRFGVADLWVDATRPG